jgi:glycosidase
MTARGVPMIYYGDEIAMSGGDDPDNRRDFPGGWSDDLLNAFKPSGRTPEQQEVFHHL